MVLEPGLLPSKVSSGEFVVEEEFDVGVLIEGVEEEFIQAAAIDRALEPTMDVVGLRIVFDCASC